MHWIHTQTGIGKIEIDGKEFILDSNCGILITPYLPHNYSNITNEWKIAYFNFGGTLVNEILTLLGIGEYLYIDELDRDVDCFIEKLIANNKIDDTYYPLEVAGYIYSFLMKLKIHLLKSSPLSSKYDTIVKPIVKYLEEHYAEDVCNQDLASMVCYSAQYMTRIFKEVFHISPYRYLLNIRIRKAKELLAEYPSISIQEVCDLTGFGNPSYFISMFKKSEHMTPRAFRKLYHKK
ncbi:AraC family transcriptional regulator [Clostridium sp. C8-1-8]|uniref:AraC family transcriptional regulator n=1 Tax=Clostridium sp. C8-1-8 TaxID=2698831 RepID=UPI001367ACE7|nr:AraC family transcriptional regulator [Clostridium sp. C8-1-8]